MDNRTHIVHWILDLGLGGDAKNLVSLAAEQAKWAKVTVLTLEKEAGVRAESLLQSGVSVITGISPSVGLTEWIVANQPQLLIVHRNGAPNNVETSLVEEFCLAGVSCFEYNTFARVDPATDKLWTGHFHLSLASFTQYAKRRGISVFDLTNHKAIGYSVPIPAVVSDEERQLARKYFAVPESKFVVSRLVRPDLRKWDPMPILAMRRLLQEGVPAQLLLRAVPPQRRLWVESLLGKSVTCLEPTVDDNHLRMTLAASDVVVNYSVIGETFGLALAEAMAAGLPVIVNSTPKVDNAQIELCRHGQRGLVANTVSSLANSLKYLSEKSDQSKKLAEQGRAFIEHSFAPEIVEARLRNFLIACLQSARNGLSSAIPASSIADDAYQLTPVWLSEYENSQDECFTDDGSAIKALLDDWQVKTVRLEDALLYASNIGLRGISEKLGRRLSQGSIFRR